MIRAFFQETVRFRMMKDEARKALHYARPFVFEKDFEQVRQSNYAEAGKRIARRGWIIVLVSVLFSLIFFLNGMSAFFVWLETEESRSLISLSLWIVVSAGTLLYGVRFFRRLAQVGRWFQQKEESGETELVEE